MSASPDWTSSERSTSSNSTQATFMFDDRDDPNHPDNLVESPENSQSDALLTNHEGATQPDATVDVNKEKFQAFVTGTHKTSGNTAMMEMAPEALCIIGQHVSGEYTFRAEDQQSVSEREAQ